MELNQFAKTGWLAAAVLGGVILASGFQGSTDKTGVVDINYLVKNSSFGKQAVADLQKMQDARKAVLQFIATNRVLTNEQAIKLKDLTLLTNPTDAQKTELEKLKAEIVASKKKNDDLAQKGNVTAEEKSLMNEYADRSRSMENLVMEWDNNFAGELRSNVDKQQGATVERARTAVQEVAKAQGYTVVFEIQVAPYGANNLTDAALKAMDAKK